MLLDTRKVVASFDVFKTFPAYSSYESDIVVEKSVEPQNDRIECTHKPMWQANWNIILYKSCFSSNAKGNGFTQNFEDLQKMKESFYPKIPNFWTTAVIWKAACFTRFSLWWKQYVDEMST